MTQDAEGRAAIRQAVSVALATGLYGVSFGALAVAAGLSVPQAMALSLLMFSGGSQFAFIGVVGAGGPGRRRHRDVGAARRPQRALRPAGGAAHRRRTAGAGRWPRS